MCEKLAKLLYQLPVADVAVMRMMKKHFCAVQLDVETSPVSCLDSGAKMVQQRFDFPPVYIGADRIVENAAQQIRMFVTHDCLPMRYEPSSYQTRQLMPLHCTPMVRKHLVDRCHSFP